jgi:hybrid cluster-associated redox disulfide protein
MKIEVNKDTQIGELLMIDEGVTPILLAVGMHCIGCPASQMETIGEAAMVHGVDPQSLVDEINDYLNTEGVGAQA